MRVLGLIAGLSTTLSGCVDLQFRDENGVFWVPLALRYATDEHGAVGHDLVTELNPIVKPFDLQFYVRHERHEAIDYNDLRHDAIAVFVQDEVNFEDADYGGLHRYYEDRCLNHLRIAAWAPPGTLLHEAGHYGGLDHEPSPTNFMRKSLPDGLTIESWQIGVMLDGIEDQLEYCWNR